jgi:hypothetical protein
LIPVRPLDLAALADPNNPIFGSGEGKDSEDEDGEGGKSGKSGKSGKGREDGDDARYTNADCFPTSVPDSATQWAKACIGLSNAHPDTAFAPSDYQGMPEDCKPYVDPKCR